MYGPSQNFQNFSFTSTGTSSVSLACASLTPMSTAARTATTAVVLFFASILLFTFLWFTSNSGHRLPALHFNSTLSKLLALIEGKQNYHVKPQNSDHIAHVSNDFEEKDTMEVSTKNFSQFLMTKNRYMMVHFHAWWSPLSRRQRPAYAAAATKLKEEVVLARVDVTRETKFAAEYKIKGYPSLFFFVNGVHVDTRHYQESSDAIVAWAKGKMGYQIYNVTSKMEADRILAAKSMVVLAFLDSFEGKDAEELASASKLHTDVNFYQTCGAHIAKMFKINPKVKRPALIVLKKDSVIHNHFNGQFTRGVIGEFVSLNKHPLTSPDARSAPMLFTSVQKQPMVYAEKDSASF